MADFQSEFKGEGFIGSIIVTIHHPWTRPVT